MIPLSDENPTLHTPWMTWLLIGTTVAVWMTVQGAGSGDSLPISVCHLGLVPGEVTHQAQVGLAVPLGDGLACVVDREPINRFTPLLSMFLHGSWGHLLGNMLFFWVFGNNIEDSMGRLKYVIFYLLAGIAAALAQVAVSPDSQTPLVGASGAIAGVLGGYALQYPRARILTAVFVFFIFFVEIPALVMLGIWIFLQFLPAVGQLASPDVGSQGGVAYFAHIGGFLFGLAAIKLFAERRSKAYEGRGPKYPVY
jgi:membrane associated rhomboid family serine protease